MQDNSSWEKGKQRHIQLSDAAADKYDELYEQANFATGSYMRFEISTISRLIDQAPAQTLAIDLGCGTGRDSFLLAKKFDQVYGFDFSKQMIRVANRNKLIQRAGNVLFEVLDVETEPLPVADESVALVNSGFGMGSFLRSPEKAFREIRRVLQPHGISVFSFYNSEALVNALELEWRPALAARVLHGKQQLRVDFGGKTFDISARAFSLNEVRKRLEGNFKVVELLTFPTLTALFPQSLFKNDRAKTLCTQVDELLSANMEIAAGPYIIAICSKGGRRHREPDAIGYARVLQLLRFHQVTSEIREHRPVRNMTDVCEVLEAPKSEMAKSVLVAADIAHPFTPDRLDAELFLVAIPADRKVDIGTLAKVLGKKRQQLRFATQVEVEELTGFQVGSIPPFGLPKSIPVILDSRLDALKKVWCGTGKATESIHLRVEDLKKLSAFSVADISRPEVENP
jgi:prolyl-tRNA editing enzyme YbaK/EbsC (Cys-tRNA(Pro) deacylase)/ubiquinone/menaquinone biosynthesis C-methylase UbiE